MRPKDLLLLFVSCIMNSCLCAEKVDASCLAGIRDVVVKRDLAKQGFHRDLITTIEWSVQNNCSIMLKETLPSGVFVDLDQANMISQQLGYKISTDSRVDVEAPAHKADPQSLMIYLSQSQHTISREGRHSASISIPVHARYHSPSVTGKTHATISIGSPRILAKCNAITLGKDCKTVKMSCDNTGSRSCDWIELPTSSNVISVDVPVGPHHHGLAVTVVTLLCTTIGTVWIFSQIVH